MWRPRTYRWATVSAFMAVACLSGCYGIIDGPSHEASATRQVSVDGFPRLSHAQWELTVGDLFGLDSTAGLARSFASDPLGGKAFDNDYAALDVGPSLFAD